MSILRALIVVGGLLVALFAVTGCEPSAEFDVLPDKSSLIGVWLREQPAGDGYEGIVLEADGRASVLGVTGVEAANWDWANGQLLMTVYEDHGAAESGTTLKRMMVVQLDRYSMTLETQSDYFSGRYLRRDDAVGRLVGRVSVPERRSHEAALILTLESEAKMDAEPHHLLSKKLRSHSNHVDGSVPFSLYFIHADLQQGSDYQLIVELVDAEGQRHRHAKHDAAINRNGDPASDLWLNLVPLKVKPKGG